MKLGCSATTFQQNEEALHQNKICLQQKICNSYLWCQLRKLKLTVTDIPKM